MKNSGKTVSFKRWAFAFLAIGAAGAATAATEEAPRISDAANQAPLENKRRKAKFEFVSVKEIPADTLLADEQEKLWVARMKKSQSRSPAALDDVGESLLSAEAKTLRDQLAGVKSAEALDAIIRDFDAEEKYKALPNDAKWIALQLSLYRGWKSFLYRARPFVENEKARAVHSLLLTTLRTTYSFERVGYPSPQWQGGAMYVAEPLAGMGPEIENESDLQKWLAEWVAVYGQALRRANALDLSKPIVFDARFLYGPGAFKDGLRRYQWIGEAERLGYVSTLYGSAAYLQMMLAYSWADVLSVAQEIGKLTGFEQVRIWNDVQGSPAKQRVEKIRKFKEFGKLNPTDGKVAMANAWKYVQSGARAAGMAWDSLKTRTAGESQFLDTEWWRSNAALTGKNVEMMKKHAAGGTVPLTSMLTGETVSVNLRAFFTNPPADLKDFMPTKFVDKDGPVVAGSCRTSTCTKTIDGRKFTYRNWDYGRAIGWDAAKYRPYFPDVGADAAAPGKVVRVTSQSAGSGTLSFFFGFVAL